MGGLGFFAGFFALIVLFSIGSQGSDTDTATSTPRGTDSTVEERGHSVQDSATIAEDTRPSTRVTAEEIERKLAEIFDEVDELEEEVRTRLLHEPPSPYAGAVTLRASNSRSEDPEREYLTITASSHNTQPIDISDWYLESYVTEETAAIPRGVHTPISVYEYRNSPHDIYLNPGERALLHSDSAPQGFSFHENVCTGYFDEHEDYHPSLRNQCPQPIDEMIEFGSIDLDNDSCYEAVRSINRCETAREDGFRNISTRCERFIADDLNYGGCLENHRYDPLFDDVGVWHVYLNKRRDLWRDEREIIQLKDENGRIIDVVEY